MSEMTALLKKLAETTDNGLGEALRALTFVGKGYGCYENFVVRPDAIPWPDEYRRQFVGLHFSSTPEDLTSITNGSYGFRYHIAELIIDVFWFWEQDGILTFRLREGDNVLASIENCDCKHPDEWKSKDEGVVVKWPKYEKVSTGQ